MMTRSLDQTVVRPPVMGVRQRPPQKNWTLISPLIIMMIPHTSLRSMVNPNKLNVRSWVFIYLLDIDTVLHESNLNEQPTGSERLHTRSSPETIPRSLHKRLPSLLTVPWNKDNRALLDKGSKKAVHFADSFVSVAHVIQSHACVFTSRVSIWNPFG